jgi:hypothetical protein
MIAPSCGMLVNGALSFVGAGGGLQAGYVGYAGSLSGASSDSTPAPLQMLPVNDPLANKYTFPTPSGCIAPPGTVTGKNKNAVTVMTGTQNISGNTCWTGNVSLAGVNFTGSGTIIFEGNVTIDKPSSGYAVKTATGVTLDIDKGTLTDNTNGLYKLQDAATGATACNSYALVQPPSNSNTISLQAGNAVGSVNGIIYAPSAQLYFQDSGGDVKGGTVFTSDIIVNSFMDKTSYVTINGCGASATGSLITKVSLVE